MIKYYLWSVLTIVISTPSSIVLLGGWLVWNSVVLWLSVVLWGGWGSGNME